MLSVDVMKTVGDFAIQAKFDVPSGATVLFGPSGSGKTSIINMIAGLMTPDRGRILCRGRLIFDSGARIDLPPYHRAFGYVFQDGRLFPHMTVAKNLDYGRKHHRLPYDRAAHERIVDMLDIGHLTQRRPGTLSGGERQRVAIGRALLMNPQLLLLDEPLASLDAARKREILPYLIRLRDASGIPMIYVTHHVAEVRRIATVVVRLEAGRVLGVGAPETIAASTDDLEG
ncbi:MAG: molybdenum ABC transporter ATP-binding protein [Xanthobacteraceae bacterium]|nr:molybdenum ABC transporter ATP-binding protein [Xanthobacteraceae bacterium]PWB65597.1 MAG: molybdenum ABC transporter ATP-binding protein [Bradyrhizobiaceae bacterium]